MGGKRERERLVNELGANMGFAQRNLLWSL
jgi:hypothetical protein